MRVQGHYDPAQDRVLLRLSSESSPDVSAVWLTRRHWTEIAVACDRARAALGDEGASPRPSRNTTAEGKAAAGRGGSRAEKAAAREAGGRGDVQAGIAEANLVTTLKFRRLPGGLRIEIATEGPSLAALTLKGENLTYFADLVQRLAATAKWDLPAAIARMQTQAPAPKRMLH